MIWRVYDSSASHVRPIILFFNKSMVLRLGIDFDAKREHVVLIPLAPLFPATAKFQMDDGRERLTPSYRLKINACP